MGSPVPSKVPLLSLPSSYIYQKRWVKLDADYLRYFDSEKVRGEVSGGAPSPPRHPSGRPGGTEVPRDNVPGAPRERGAPNPSLGSFPTHLRGGGGDGASLPPPRVPPQDAYSKRFIPVSSISRVASVGDQKFEVVTTNRNFVFRAESDGERWGDTSPDPILGLLPSSWQPPGPSDEPPQPQP